MTKENRARLYKHYCILANGNFNERTFDFELEAEKPDDSGSMHMGKMSQQRIDLIKSDAKRNKKDMEKKYPELLIKKEEKPLEEKPMEPTEAPKEKKHTKSGRKK